MIELTFINNSGWRRPVTKEDIAQWLRENGGVELTGYYCISEWSMNSEGTELPAPHTSIMMKPEPITGGASEEELDDKNWPGFIPCREDKIKVLQQTVAPSENEALAKRIADAVCDKITYDDEATILEIIRSHRDGGDDDWECSFEAENKRLREALEDCYGQAADAKARGDWNSTMDNVYTISKTALSHRDTEGEK